MPLSYKVAELFRGFFGECSSHSEPAIFRLAILTRNAELDYVKVFGFSALNMALLDGITAHLFRLL
jgi:hypothetical protein